MRSHEELVCETYHTMQELKVSTQPQKLHLITNPISVSPLLQYLFVASELNLRSCVLLAIALLTKRERRPSVSAPMHSAPHAMEFLIEMPTLQLSRYDHHQAIP